MQLYLLCIGKKTGPLGPQGFQGELSEGLVTGTCGKKICANGRTLKLFYFGKLIEKHNQKPLTSDIKNKI